MLVMPAIDMHVSYFKPSWMKDTRKTTAKAEHVALLYIVFFAHAHHRMWFIKITKNRRFSITFEKKKHNWES